MGPVEPYDVVMLVILAGCVAFGAWKGVAWQIASLASLTVSAGVAVHFSEPFTPYFGDSAPWNRCAAMLVLYVSTALGIWLLFRLVSGVIDRVQLKEFDRQMGGLFGAAKGLVWCFVITFFAVTLSEFSRRHVLNSYSGHFAAEIIERARPLLPEEVLDFLGKHLDEMGGKLDHDHDRYHDMPADDMPVDDMLIDEGEMFNESDILDEAARRIIEAGSSDGTP